MPLPSLCVQNTDDEDIFGAARKRAAKSQQASSTGGSKTGPVDMTYYEVCQMWTIYPRSRDTRPIHGGWQRVGKGMPGYIG